jgi:hypothetical protein
MNSRCEKTCAYLNPLYNRDRTNCLPPVGAVTFKVWHSKKNNNADELVMYVTPATSEFPKVMTKIIHGIRLERRPVTQIHPWDLVYLFCHTGYVSYNLNRPLTSGCTFHFHDHARCLLSFCSFLCFVDPRTTLRNQLVRSG